MYPIFSFLIGNDFPAMSITANKIINIAVNNFSIIGFRYTNEYVPSGAKRMLDKMRIHILLILICL